MRAFGRRIETERLSELAARCLSPDDIGEGARIIHKLSSRLHLKMSLYSAFIIVAPSFLSIGAIVNIFCFIYYINSSNHLLYLFEATLFSAASIVIFFSSRYIQRRKRFFVSRPYDIDTPLPLEHLLAQLALGDIAAWIPTESPVGTNAWRNSAGDIFDEPLNPSIFKNRCAPVLLSPDKGHYSELWAEGAVLRFPIHVIVEDVEGVIQGTSPPQDTHRQDINSLDGFGESPGSADDSQSQKPRHTPEEERPCKNDNPRDKWLVSGTFPDFVRGREAFIEDKISPHQADWFREVFTVGRRELRKGGQRGAQQQAINVIQGALMERFGSHLGPNGGDSTHLIKQILQGRYSGTDIKGYFSGTLF